MLNVEWTEEDTEALKKWEAENKKYIDTYYRGQLFSRHEYSHGPAYPPPIKRTGRLVNTAQNSDGWIALVVRDDNGRFMQIDPLKLSASPH